MEWLVIFSVMMCRDGEIKFDQAHYDLLVKCAEKGDMTEWNEWYKEYQNTQHTVWCDIGAWLEGADLSRAHLEGADLSYAHLEGADLSYAHLEGADLSYAHLEGANLFISHLEGVVLSGANLEGANLSAVNLEGVGLSAVNLEGVGLSAVNLEGANLSCAHLEGVALSGANLKDVTLSGANLKDVVLSGAHLEGADLSYANLEGANLSDAHLKGANLSDAHLKGANLSDAHLKGANLSCAHLEGAKLLSSHLEGVVLFGANLEGADLRRAMLKDANLSGAHLEGADLSYANLEGANLFRANLESAILSGANLEGADLRRVMLKDANMSKANLRSANVTWECLKVAKKLTAVTFPQICISKKDMSYCDLSNTGLEGVTIENTILKGANFRFARVDGTTLITGDPDKIIDDDTDFTGVGLSEARIDPKLRTRLERNIRKKQWEKRYVKPRVYPFQAALIEKWNRIKGGNSAESPKTSDTAPSESQVPKTESNRLTWEQWLKNIFIDIPTETFWWLSDYGSKTTRILLAFLGLNLIFTALYLWVVPHLPTIRQGANPMFAELMYNTSTVDPVAALIQSNMIVFSITDVATSNLDYIPMFLILAHIVLGYVILAALVTRFAIMFQSLSP